MTHPLVSVLSGQMDKDVGSLHAIVAEWVLRARSEEERATLRFFGAELGAVQRRIHRRSEPPSEEEIQVALTAVLALMTRRVAEEIRPS
jgi:hypothetical protein